MNWAEGLKAAMARGLSPDAFWRTSLKEWHALMAPGRVEAMSRAELHALLAEIAGGPHDRRRD